MQMTMLGRTEQEVSVAGLGCGGHSRLGTATGGSVNDAIGLVRHGLSLGINFIDTAAAYGTQPIVGRAIKGSRHEVIISTKASIGSAADLRASLEQSLQELGTDYVDLFNLHGVVLDQYQQVKDELLPELLAQQKAGKIRHLGITEAFIRDPSHLMLQKSLQDDDFDVVMVGFNLLNPSARKTVFPLTQKLNVGTQIMFAVRRALSNAEALEQLIVGLKADGRLREAVSNQPLTFLQAHPKVASLVEGAYRFCRHEPGADIILTGTGSRDHLEQNVRSIQEPVLADDILQELESLFGDIDSVSGN